MNSAMQLAQAQALQQALANMSPSQQAAVVQAAIAGQRKIMSWPYWSTVRYQLPAIAGTTYTLAPPVPHRTAFGYKIGDALGAAQGFDATFGAATYAETNLINPSQTRSNDDVYITGIAAMWTPESDGQIVQLATRNSSLVVGLNGDDAYYLGRLDMIPGGGGLYGIGISYLQPPSLADVWNTRWGQLDNGTPGRDNYDRLPQALIWRGTGTGKDTALTVQVQQYRNLVINSAADRAGAAGVAAWTKPVPPNVVGTYADLTIRLISQQVGKRSENS